MEENQESTQLELHFDPSHESEIRTRWELIRLDFMRLYREMETLLDQAGLDLGSVTVSEVEETSLDNHTEVSSIPPDLPREWLEFGYSYPKAGAAADREELPSSSTHHLPSLGKSHPESS